METALTDFCFTSETEVWLRDHFSLKLFDLRKSDKLVKEIQIIEKEFKKAYANSSIFDRHRVAAIDDNIVTSSYNDSILLYPQSDTSSPTEL